MLFVTWALIQIGSLFITVAPFWSRGIATQESAETGSRYLFPVYAWIHMIARWEEMQRHFLVGLLGVAVMLLGLVVGLAAGVL